MRHSGISHVIAAPPHVLWAPEPCFIINMAAHAAGAVFMILWDYGSTVVIFALMSVVWHLFLVRSYQRDRHCHMVWAARFFYSRRMPWQRTRQPAPFHGNRYAA